MAAPEAVAVDAGPDISDEILVEGIIKGQTDNFDILYERYFKRIHRFVSRRMANAADVDETVQEVFINVLGSLETFRGEAPFAAWVFGLTRRTIANRYKRKRAETVPLPSEESDSGLSLSEDIPSDNDPYANYERNERLDRIQRGAERLSSDQWELFRLHHLEHRSIEDIASATDKSRDAVKSHLYRARKLLLAR